MIADLASALGAQLSVRQDAPGFRRVVLLRGGEGLVDLWALERHGLAVEDALAAALEKDGGCTPANLAWLLSQVQIGDEVKLPGGVSPEELRGFVSNLIERLRRYAHPS